MAYFEALAVQVFKIRRRFTCFVDFFVLYLNLINCTLVCQASGNDPMLEKIGKDSGSFLKQIKLACILLVNRRFYLFSLVFPLT